MLLGALFKPQYLWPKKNDQRRPIQPPGTAPFAAKQARPTIVFLPSCGAIASITACASIFLYQKYSDGYLIWNIKGLYKQL